MLCFSSTLSLSLLTFVPSGVLEQTWKMPAASESTYVVDGGCQLALLFAALHWQCHAGSLRSARQEYLHWGNCKQYKSRLPLTSAILPAWYCLFLPFLRAFSSPPFSSSPSSSCSFCNTNPLSLFFSPSFAFFSPLLLFLFWETTTNNKTAK